MSKGSLFRRMWQDAEAIAAMQAPRIYQPTQQSPSIQQIQRVIVGSDGWKILGMEHLRRYARQRSIPLLNGLVRQVETILFGIEIGKEVQLGVGVWFIHPLGIVIGGNARIGDRVRFFGNNTVGTAKENGYPVIESDVWVGAGARILGPIRVGARSVIGANAVVVKDVPPDSVATGVPAVARPKKPQEL